MNWLSLEQFRSVLAYHPYHFWGLGDNGILRPNSVCNTYIRQYAWQNADAAGRHEIVQAIEQAESKIKRFLGYSPMPVYTEEVVAWPKYLDSTLSRYGASGADGFRMPVKLSSGKIKAVGSELKTPVGSIAVTLSDANGDGIRDTFTLGPFITTATSAEELRVYFSLTERFGDLSVNDTWRVRPIKVAFSGGQATITGPLWIIAKPMLYEGFYGTAYNPIDPAVNTNFPATLDVYTYAITPDGQTTTDSQCVLLWETMPCEGWWCCGWNNLSYTPPSSVFDPAAVGMAVGRVGIRDAENGIVLPAQALYNTTSGLWYESWGAMWREPNRVLVRYQAGDALGPDGELTTDWQTAIARMACAELSFRICSCDEANRELYRWQIDYTERRGLAGDTFNVQPGDLENPFGTKAGHLEAWRRVKNLAKVIGIHT